MRIAAVAVMLVMFAATSFGAPIFYDDFQSYVNETYYVSPGTPSTFQTAPGETPSGNIWTVTRNTIDVHGPDWVDWLCGAGNTCVDLNGSYSTQMSGQVRTTITVPTAGFYVLSFDLAGSHRYDPTNPDLNDSLQGYNTAQVSFGGWSTTITAGPDEPWTTITSPALYLSAGATTLIFADATYIPGSVPQQLVNDPMGLLLDDVTVDYAAPEPASFVLLVFGAGLIAFRRRLAV